ncbi:MULTISPECIES: hypothetical protein [Clostridia]|uniref:hypothetical protein n=1 Tax=Clostridia TaxID=186801 RepID=UPI000EA26500|nr:MULTISPECIES: hypothetical protein [Clostridia]NBJ71367.1 hypothetical protein [Roseburia sp. 1XD42-34]RKI74457.1 hypothetical protein D7V87_18660 [Clostridium sp. 1xD42-85]
MKKVAELDIPLALLPIPIEIGPEGTLTPSLTITVDSSGISQNIIPLKDMVVNIGYVPATSFVGGTRLGSANIPFQKETTCPGVCPEDRAVESSLQVEAIIVQPLPNAIIPALITLGPTDIARVKIILRTVITVTRPVIKSKDRCFTDVNQNRCENPTPLNINPPVPPTN